MAKRNVGSERGLSSSTGGGPCTSLEHTGGNNPQGYSHQTAVVKRQAERYCEFRRTNTHDSKQSKRKNRTHIMFYLPETSSYSFAIVPLLEIGRKSMSLPPLAQKRTSHIKRKRTVHDFSPLSKLLLNNGSNCKFSVFFKLNVPDEGANSDR